MLAQCATNHLAEAQVIGHRVRPHGGVQLCWDMDEEGDALGSGGGP